MPRSWLQKGRGTSPCTRHNLPQLSGPYIPLLFPLPAQLPGKIKERPPTKKMIISLKINDPVVTKVGNVPLSS